jgi:hypothetical protein
LGHKLLADVFDEVADEAGPRVYSAEGRDSSWRRGDPVSWALLDEKPEHKQRGRPVAARQAFSLCAAKLVDGNH